MKGMNNAFTHTRTNNNNLGIIIRRSDELEIRFGT